MVCTIPASAWTWLVRPRKASVVTMSGAGFDAGEGNPGSVIILQKRLGVGMAAATSSVGRGWSFYSGCCRSFVPDNLTAFMAYHTAVPSHHACCPYNETCVCRWGVPTLPVSGRLYDHWCPPYIRPVTCVGSVTWAGQLSEDVMT
ncbi:hypothetical protein BHM03_00021293 [Ensete ventricosum]|nr:hypothetical protein BHM03_00021293 [Ensete ventricosum]